MHVQQCICITYIVWYGSQHQMPDDSEYKSSKLPVSKVWGRGLVFPHIHMHTENLEG